MKQTAESISRILALLVPFLGLGCEGDMVEITPALRPVRTFLVEASDASTSRTLAGVARAGTESKLSFKVPGTVARVSVDLGDSVRKGEVLARLESIDYELKVEEAEAGLAQAMAGLRRAEADFERVRALYENNNAAESEYDAGRAARESAVAQVDAGSKRLEQARQQLGYTQLRAPVDGAIASIDVEVNENVNSGQPLFLITSGVRAEVEVAIPEVMISQVSVGQPVLVRCDALPGREFKAEVSELGVAAIGTSSTFEMSATVADVAPEIRSGMAAEVTLRLTGGSGSGGARGAIGGAEGAETKRIIVPSLAVGEDREGRFVFVLERTEESHGTVRRRSVEIGRSLEALTKIQIVRGLEEGEEIVTAGVRRISDGMAVRALDSNEDQE
jgi:RND family efflux transporter MFP subunit